MLACPSVSDHYSLLFADCEECYFGVADYGNVLCSLLSVSLDGSCEPATIQKGRFAEFLGLAFFFSQIDADLELFERIERLCSASRDRSDEFKTECLLLLSNQIVRSTLISDSNSKFRRGTTSPV